MVVRPEIKTDQMVLIRYFRQSHRLAAGVVEEQISQATMADRVAEIQEQETRQAHLHLKGITAGLPQRHQVEVVVALVQLEQVQPQT